MNDLEFSWKMKEVLSHFSNADERMKLSALFNYVVNSLLRNDDPYLIIDQLIEMIEKNQKEFEERITNSGRHYLITTQEIFDKFKEEVKYDKDYTPTYIEHSLYAFRYNSCIHESAWATVSIHKTLAGAEKAMAEHKELKRVEWLRIYPTAEEQEDMPFGEFEDWYVEPIKIQV